MATIIKRNRIYHLVYWMNDKQVWETTRTSDRDAAVRFMQRRMCEVQLALEKTDLAQNEMETGSYLLICNICGQPIQNKSWKTVDLTP